MTEPFSPSPLDDPTARERARALARARRGWQAAELALTVGYALAWWLSGGAAALRDWAQATAPGWWGALALFNAVFWGGQLVLGAPLSYLGGFRLEQRYGLLKQSLASWLADEAKGLVLSAAIGLPLLGGLYALLGRFPATWWLGALAGYAGLSLVAIVVVPVWIMPLFHRFTPLDETELTRRLEALAGRAGLRVQGVYRWGLGEKTTTANAALAGLGATRRILISDTMLEGYTPDEIEAVLAHEMGHQAHRDIARLWGVNLVVMAAAFWLAQGALARWSGWHGLAGPADIANLPVLLLVLTAASLVAMPLLNGYSRRREHAADGFALAHAGRPAALASALEKLAGQNLADPAPPAWVEWWFYSHPAIARRVARIRAEAGPAA